LRQRIVSLSRRFITWAGCVPDFGECAAAGQGVAEEGVAAVMDRERREPLRAEHFAGRAESLPERMAGERPRFASWLQ
jgi:hypothetical protein